MSYVFYCQIINYMKYFVLLLLPLMFGCSSHSGSYSECVDDSTATQTDSLSADSPVDDIDWIPEEFKAEHPDEWAVVKPAINIQQRAGETDFGKIDVLVRNYLDKKKISLPADADKRIRRIAEICRANFNIEGYDQSNVGLLVANDTWQLFEAYVNWLYEKEATKVLSRDRFVDIEREMELYKSLNDAMYDVCDTVTFAMGGSGGWVGSAQVRDLLLGFRRSMFQAIIGSTLEPARELDVPVDMFDKECKALIDIYEPFKDDQPEDVSPIVNRFRNAFHAWYAYRKSTAAGLKDKEFRKAYESITYSFARTYFFHLKNRFSDIGLMSNTMVELCLEEDCSNQELLEFNYEVKYKELCGNP